MSSKVDSFLEGVSFFVSGPIIWPAKLSGRRYNAQFSLNFVSDYHAKRLLSRFRDGTLFL